MGNIKRLQEQAPMSFVSRWVAVTSLSAAALIAQAAEPEESAFDGRWSVLLVCADTNDRNGSVRGYQYAFSVSIRGGVIQGEYGAPGHPASVSYAGQVSDDGSLEIKATGNTGRSEYSLGKVASGTVYSYSMHGKLVGTTGQATRTEGRPCTATFAKS